MAVSTRIQPIARDIDVMLGGLKGPDASKLFAEFAAAEIADAKESNRSILGRVPPFKIFVDGKQGASLESVRADGTISVEFELVGDVLTWISAMLQQHSPVKSGRYKRSHILLADGSEVAVSDQVPIAREYVFINTMPYARKIERGSSSEAPDGVYQAVALLARSRFGNIAKISFGFRTVIGGGIVTGPRGNRASNRNPAVIVGLRG